MKVVRVKTGPVTTRPFFEDHEIEETCIEELKKLDLLPNTPSPIRIDRFIEKRFNLSHQYEDFPDGILGFTKFGVNGAEAIVVARSLDEGGNRVSERRLRTTLAHEAGHALLHASIFVYKSDHKSLFDQDHDETPKILCRDVVGSNQGEGSKYSGRWWEFQANKAMGALLMPRPLLEQALAPFLKNAGLLGGVELTDENRQAAIEALAETFDVNPVVARFRIQNLYPLTQSHQLRL